MRVMVIGGGGREHALAWAIGRSPRVTRLVAAPGNPGIARHAECVPVPDTAVDDLVGVARRERVDLVVVGPELPLSLGIADRLRGAGLAVFGPSAAAARIESSKAFSKDLMARHGVPTARFVAVSDATEARRVCRELGAPLVVKTDGLAAGKGAIVCRTLEEADRAVARCLEERSFGASGDTVVIEEFMHGEEMSFFVLTDGVSAVAVGAAQDHKAVFDDDQGPNTGGMGAYSPAPVFTSQLEQRVMAEIVLPTIRALGAEGAPYQGALYVGLMITRDGPRVVEFNCRFGDPECQVLLPRLGEDLVPLLAAVATGGGLPSSVRFRPDSSVCVVLASDGYPGKYETGRVVRGVDEAEQLPDVTVFHAATASREGRLLTAGGRVLGVQALGADVAEAIGRAYDAVSRISFDGMHFRKDIGRRAIARR